MWGATGKRATDGHVHDATGIDQMNRDAFEGPCGPENCGTGVHGRDGHLAICDENKVSMEVVGGHITRNLRRIGATIALTAIIDRLEFSGRDHAMPAVPEKDGAFGGGGCVNFLRDPMIRCGTTGGTRAVIGEESRGRGETRSAFSRRVRGFSAVFGREGDGVGSGGHFEGKERCVRKRGAFLQMLKDEFQFLLSVFTFQPVPGLKQQIRRHNSFHYHSLPSV